MKWKTPLGVLFLAPAILVNLGCSGAQTTKQATTTQGSANASRAKPVSTQDAPSSFVASHEPETSTGSDRPLSVRLVPQLGHGNGVQGISISLNGKVAATASADKTLRVWDPQSGILLRSIAIGDQVWDVAILRDNRRALVAGGSKIEVWDLLEGTRVAEAKTQQSRMRRLHRSDRVVLADGSGGVSLWNVEPLSLIRQLRPSRQGTEFGAEDLDVSPNDEWVALGRDDGRIVLLDLATGNSARELRGHSKSLVTVRYSRAGDVLTSFGKDQTIRKWDVASGRELQHFSYPERIVDADLINDATAVVSSSDDTTKVIRLEDGSIVGTLDAWPGTSLWRTSKVVASSDGKRAVIATGDGTVQFSSLVDRGPVHATPARRNGAFSLALSPRGDRLAIGFGGGEVDLWDSVMASRVRRFPYIHDDRGLGPVVFSPDGNWLLRQADMEIFVIDLRSGSLVRTLKSESPATIYAMAVSPDGQWLAAAGAQSLSVFELGTGRFRWANTKQPFIDEVAFSPDGRRVISCSANHDTRVYDASSGSELRTLGGPISPGSIDFLDDNLVLLGGWDSLALWDVRTGRMVRQYAARRSGAGVAAYTPDKRFIVTGSDFGEMTLIDASSGRVVTKFMAHDDNIRQVVPSSDGRFIYTTSFDGTIRVTPLDTLIQGTAATDPRALVWVADNSDWLSYSADGYFDASRRGGGLVAAVSGFDGYRVDQLAVRNNRPDLTLNRLGLGTPQALSLFKDRYQTRLRRLGFAEDALSRNLSAAPTATIAEFTRQGRTAKLRCRFAGNGRNLKRYFVFVNDVAVGDGEGTPLSAGQVSAEVNVPLSAGRNKVELSVLSDVGVESFRDIVTVNVAEKAVGDLYYLGFGVSDYVDTRLNLKYAHKDAEDLGQLFERMREGTYNRVLTQTLTDAQVTKASVEKARSFLAPAKIDDTVVVFVAGHGVFGSGKGDTYYFMPHEADISRITATGVSFELIEDLVTGIAPRKKLLLLDTCESGERDGEDEVVRVTAGRSRGLAARGIRPVVFTQGDTGRRVPSQVFSQDRFIFNDLSRRSGTIVFSASHGVELSYEDDRLKNGIFTYELLQALSGSQADADRNGSVTTDELRSYVSQAVSTRTEGLQNPTVDRDNLEALFDFPVPGGRASPRASAPTETEQKVRRIRTSASAPPTADAETPISISLKPGVTTVVIGKDGRPTQVIAPPTAPSTTSSVPARPMEPARPPRPEERPWAGGAPSTAPEARTPRRRPQIFKSTVR